ncbi:RecBCD enzyme subunit RecB [Gammaproteobacteria bacterium]
MNIPAALDPITFPLHGNRLIEASAGTGKTWTIAALYVRLVLGHGDSQTGFGRSLLPTEILVVTFTEAATKELRERIRGRLTEASRCFRRLAAGDYFGEESAYISKLTESDPFLAKLTTHYNAGERASCARRLEIAAEWMDEAAIYTIHGWCNRMLRQHAFDSGSLFQLEVSEGDSKLLDEVVRDYWRKFFYPLDEEAILALGTFVDSPDTLARQLRELFQGFDIPQDPKADSDVTSTLVEIEPRALLENFCQWEIHHRKLEQQARRSWAEDRGKIEEKLRETSTKGWLNATNYPKASFEARLQSLADWAERGIPPRDKKWLEGFGQSHFKMTKAHQDKAPQHRAFVYLDELNRHATSKPDFSRELLFHAAGWVRDRYNQEKQRRAQLDFDDLLTHLDRALQPPSGDRLAEVIRHQYPVALIDEFQDTDPVQYRIFANVYSVNENREDLGLFMIGDPKQAIYSFRGADIYTYLKARVTTQGRHYTLDCNYRSTVPLVGALNRVFEYSERHVEGAFRFRNVEGENPIPFLPVAARGRAEQLWIEGQSVAALTFWCLAGEEGKALALTEYREAMAESTAAEIVRLLNLGLEGKAGFLRAHDLVPLCAADIAILVRDRHEASAIRQALAVRQVRSVYLSDRDSVFDSDEASDLLFWLKACAEPEQERGVRAALGSATLDLDYETLEILNQNELRWEAEIERFRGYRGIWRNQGVLPMLHRLLADFSLPARLLRKTGGERVLTNLLHLSELLQVAGVEWDGESALIRYLSDAIVNGNREVRENILRLESDAELVQVVTIHKSKGLEYPLVFLPFICSFKEVSATSQGWYRYHTPNGELQIDFEGRPEAKQRADLERIQEDLRLFYVAITRARHACWLGVAPVKSGNVKDCQLNKSAMGYLLAGGKPISALELGSVLADMKGDSPFLDIVPAPSADNQQYLPNIVEPLLEEARAITGRVVEHWWIASYSALKLDVEGKGEASQVIFQADAPDTPLQANLAETVDEDELPEESFSAATGLHRFPHGPRSGTFLHGLLEWAAEEGFDRVAEDSELREDAIARRCERRGWTHWIRSLNEWLGGLLIMPMALPSGPVALADLEKDSYQKELEFWFAAHEADALLLDKQVTAGTMDGLPRPRLLPNQINGMIKGFIDLVFLHRGCYYVVDYKSNWLGEKGIDYTREAMRDAVLEKRYDLQYTLYLLALHRQLQARLRETYDYDTHIGGAVYIFLRGIDGPYQGLHLEKPPRALIEELDRIFSGKKN